MANKRQLKKAIQRACGEMAGQCIMAQDLLSSEENYEKWNEIIIDIAMLQAQGVKRVGNKFNKADEKALTEWFRDQANAIVGKMNALLPKKQ
jgi:hypothetical protein